MENDLIEEKPNALVLELQHYRLAEPCSVEMTLPLYAETSFVAETMAHLTACGWHLMNTHWVLIGGADDEDVTDPKTLH